MTEQNTRRRIGLIVNPVAGMGGRVGLKGTDGALALRRALELGAVPEAAGKASRALAKLTPIKEELIVVTCEGAMGEAVARELGFAVEIAYRPPSAAGPPPDSVPARGLAPASGPAPAAAPAAEPAAETAAQGDAGHGGKPPLPATTGQDTRAAARAIAGSGVELLLFAGGDGTARDIFEAVGTEQVVLGIPAGVKIHSPVYANSPAQAGELALRFLTEGGVPAGQREVVDIDEDAVRRDVLQTALYGYLTVPLDETHMQNPKAPTAVTEEAAQQGIAEDVVEGMEEGTCYIIGPGTTTRAIMQALGLPCTLLGVDVVLNRRVLARRERAGFAEHGKVPVQVDRHAGGGQGICWAGAISRSAAGSKRIGKENVIIVATPGKWPSLRRPLLADTGDAEADAMLAGFHRVKIGYWLERAHKIAG